MLQALFEFQSILSDLTGADITNASMYDGATSLVEAVFMAERIKNKKRVLIANSLNPEYQEVLKTYLKPRDLKVDYIDFKDDGTIDFNTLEEKSKKGFSALVIQSPNYFGIIEDIEK